MYWLRWHYHVKDIEGAPYKIKKKTKQTKWQNRRQSVVIRTSVCRTYFCMSYIPLYVIINIIIIIIINDNIYNAVSKASRTGNKVSCQPNDCPNRWVFKRRLKMASDVRTSVCHTYFCMSYVLLYVIHTSACHTYLCMSYVLLHVICTSVCHTYPVCHMYFCM